MINRFLQPQIEQKLGSGKAIFIIGPRQVGKTTLALELLKSYDYLHLDCDDPTTRRVLTNPNTEQLKNLIGHKPFVFIDEAQRIDNIGITLKIITDQIKSTQLLVSGSSAFELNNKTNESLTGRKWTYHLFPIAWQEYEQFAGFLKSEQTLPIRLVYGFYPDIINNPSDETELLKNLTNSYLFKDILTYSGIRKPEILEKLLRALAFQVGHEVSYNELSQLLKIDTKTVISYIDLLEQSYVVFRLGSFSRNLRNEIKTNQKIYFYDNGVRNAVIGNFSPLEVRQDVGALWENFLMAERLKLNTYKQSTAGMYFWRTVRQQEIDYVEEDRGEISAYEFKWNSNAKMKTHKIFNETYKAQQYKITRENFRDFVI